MLWICYWPSLDFSNHKKWLIKHFIERIDSQAWQHWSSEKSVLPHCRGLRNWNRAIGIEVSAIVTILRENACKLSLFTCTRGTQAGWNELSVQLLQWRCHHPCETITKQQTKVNRTYHVSSIFIGIPALTAKSRIVFALVIPPTFDILRLMASAALSCAMSERTADTRNILCGWERSKCLT